MTQPSQAVIVGGGIGGLCTALRAAELGLRTCVVTASSVGAGGSSSFAQGGIAIATAVNDSPDAHAADTQRVSCGLADPEVVQFVTLRATHALEFLQKYGMRFDRQANGEFALSREAGHAVPRVLHHLGDATGRELMRILTLAARREERITLIESATVEELLCNAAGEIVGICVRRNNEVGWILSSQIVLAMGGAAALFSRTSNPLGNRGDAIALAAAAGAELADLEFVQFHPTGLRVDADPSPLVTEALRGVGATLIDETGRRVMSGVHPHLELAPRDIVAQQLYRCEMAGQQLFLDTRAALGASIVTRFPGIYQTCLEHGIDATQEPIPVAPVAHFHMGGILINRHARTSVPGLWAVGECTCTKLHGANRLASNSLLEAVVFGLAAAEDVSAAVVPPKDSPETQPRPTIVQMSENSDQNDLMSVRHILWKCAGVFRTQRALRGAISALEPLMHSPGNRARRAATAAFLMVTAMLQREESRGGHAREDFPQSDSIAYRQIYLRGQWRREFVAG